jgi:hypothetical protein
MANTYELIASVTVGSGGTSSIDFASIPATYTDLLLKVSLRDSGSGSGSNVKVSFNGVGGTSYSSRLLFADSSSIGSYTSTSAAAFEHQYGPASGATSNTFGNFEIYIPNYLSSNYKMISVDSVNENNAASSYMGISGGLFSNTGTISSIKVFPYTGGNTFAQYSTAYLYGIKNS